MDKTRTTPGRPQLDGMVERFKRTFEAMLSKFVADNQRDWDQHLPLLMMAYRSAVHETTGYSPCELMLGNNILLPVDLLMGSPEAECVGDPIDYAQALQTRLEKVHQCAQEHLRLETQRLKRLYGHKLNVSKFKQGDLVWFFNPRLRKGYSPKLQCPWEGPYTIVKKINDVVYRIHPSSKCKVISCSPTKDEIMVMMMRAGEANKDMMMMGTGGSDEDVTVMRAGAWERDHRGVQEDGGDQSNFAS